MKGINTSSIFMLGNYYIIWLYIFSAWCDLWYCLRSLRLHLRRNWQILWTNTLIEETVTNCIRVGIFCICKYYCKFTIEIPMVSISLRKFTFKINYYITEKRVLQLGFEPRTITILWYFHIHPDPLNMKIGKCVFKIV